MAKRAKSKTVLLAVSVAALCLVAAAWRWTPISDWLDARALASLLKKAGGEPYAPWIVLAAYIIGSQIMFPIVILIAATAYIFGPWLGLAYALAGSIAGALVTYAVGYWMGQESFRRIAGSRFGAIDQALREHGLAAVIGTHLFPVGPFTLVNLGAGVAGVGVWEFVLGCAIGMLPGIVLTTVFERQLEVAFAKSGLWSAGLLAVGAAILAGCVLWLRRRRKP